MTFPKSTSQTYLNKQLRTMKRINDRKKINQLEKQIETKIRELKNMSIDDKRRPEYLVLFNDMTEKYHKLTGRYYRINGWM